MDPVRNPFAPGAGTQPPELAGRAEIIERADIALQRLLIGRHERSQMLLGLRGTGKTVLLQNIMVMAEKHHHAVSFIEAPEEKTLPALLYPKIHQVLRSLSLIEQARSAAHSALRALRSFAGAFKISSGDISISVDAEAGSADSGDLEFDLSELFARVGRAAQAAKTPWTLIIDEIQYLTVRDLSALIVAIHHVNQRALPIIFFGAGLPQVAALAGDAKSYAERLFSYVTVGPLDRQAACDAIKTPIEDEGETIEQAALDAIYDETHGYPYFLQEWGYQAWNCAAMSPIGQAVVSAATAQALRRLDEGFFRVRLDRLTPRERAYVHAMASLGEGPYRTSDVARVLGDKPTTLGPVRDKIIKKGMIYSPAHGDLAFTVPLFDQFLVRSQAGQPT